MKTCSVCQTNQSSQQAETFLPHDIPDGPWQVLATDIFHLDGNDYVIVADYYSKMPFVRHLTSNPTSATVISALKQLFGEHGIPCKLLSDNGPQYDCVEFRTFAADSSMSLALPDTPSPTDLPNAWSRLSRKPCSRQGRAALIQTSLCCAYTPPPLTTTSPPLPNSYTPGSSDPTSLSSPPTHPKIQLSTRTCKPASGRRRSTGHDRSARDLPPLHTGQHVRLQEANGTWTPATVVENRPEPRSYTVHTPNGGLYRRNRRQLQDFTAPPKHITWADQTSPDTNRTSSPDQQQQINMPATTTAPPPKADSFTPSGQTSDNPAPAQTPLRCSSRHTKPPQRLIESM